MLRLFGILALAVSALCGGTSFAQQIDLSLNLEFNNPSNGSSGGTWTLVGKSDDMTEGENFGISSVSVLLREISTQQLAAPRGTITTDQIDPDNDGFNAGFNFFNFDEGLGELTVNQFDLGTEDEQSYFYGVGMLSNGAPNYPDRPSGSNTLGPAFTTLENVVGEPWGVPDSDFLMDPAWDIAVPLATGQFAPGLQPDFAGMEPVTAASVFTNVPVEDGNTDITAASLVTWIVRNDLGSVLGDYNMDGKVNAADYTLWRDTLGNMVAPGTGADGDSSGVIDAGDYDVWKMNFGNMISSGSALTGAVPEPMSGLMLLIGVGIGLFSRGIRPKSAIGNFL